MLFFFSIRKSFEKNLFGKIHRKSSKIIKRIIDKKRFEIVYTLEKSKQEFLKIFLARHQQ